MSIGPLGGIGPSAAGAPLSQSAGSEVDRARQDTAAQKRRIRNDQKADDAAGIAATDGDDKESEERDADGRRIWEIDEKQQSDEQADQNPSDVKSKDPSGDRGTHLDLSG